MNDLVFSDFGIEIFRQDDQLYLRYDAGHFVPEMREARITPAQAAKAQLDEQSAYEVVLSLQQKQA